MLKTALIIDGDSEGGQRALQQLEASIERNEKEARQLAAAYGAADVATTKLAQAQIAAKAAVQASQAAHTAGEITLEEYTRQLLETKTAVGLVAAEHRSAVAELNKARAATGAAIDRGNQFVQSAGAQRIGAQQLGMQLGDMATMFALGARPMQIFASQSGQMIQALQLMTGGTSRFAAFMLGGWGTAVTAGAMVLVPLIGYLLDAKEAAKAAEMGADALGQAQSALGGIFDLTSGKIKSQNELLIANARLMAVQLRGDALTRARSSQETLAEAGRSSPSFLEAQTIGVQGLGDTVGQRNATRITAVVNALRSGTLTPAQAIERSATLNFEGVNVTREQFQQAVIDRAYAREASRVAGEIDQSLDSGVLATDLRRERSSHQKKDTGHTSAEIERRFEDELHGYTQQALSAKRQMATSAEERAELEMRGVEWDRRETLAKIAADKEYGPTQKADLAAAAEHLADLQRSVVDFELRRAQEQEAERLADAVYQATRETLQVQLDLVDTEAGRKSLALQIYDAEHDYLRSKLDAVILSETANEEEKRRAQIARDALDATAGQQREGVSRANATSVERYLRELHRSPEQINEAIDRIKIDGLEALNDGLVDAIMGAKSLGDVFHDVAGQIVADLLRIAIQRQVIAPLADALFGAAPGSGGGSSAGGLVATVLGSLFGGGRAAGGPVSPGKFYAVNETSTAPGLFIPLSPGRIDPAGSGQAAPAVVELHIGAGEMFEAKVVRISGDVALRTVQTAAPGVVANQTGRYG